MLNGNSAYGSHASSTGPVVYEPTAMTRPWHPLAVIW